MAVEQTILSTNFPDRYRSNEECLWIIKAPTGSKIRLDVKDFQTEACCDKLKVDFANLRNTLLFQSFFQNFTFSLQIYNSSSSLLDRNLLIRELAGTNIGGRTVSSFKNFVAISFKSDSSVTFRGFNITYTAEGSLFAFERTVVYIA